MKLIIEMGGTKINLFIIAEYKKYQRVILPTTTPDAFKNYILVNFTRQNITKIIFACFGPIALDEKNYGKILNTPKKGWQNLNIYEWLKSYICSDIVLLTDVALPALGAIQKYNLQENFCSYLSIGTGIGGCNIFKGQLLQNEVHPEVGHMYLEASDQVHCQYHTHCFENLTSGKYFLNEYNLQFREIDMSHPGWSDLTIKLAKLVWNLFAAIGVEYVILGGGVIRKDMKNQLIENLHGINNSYLPVLNKKDIHQRLILDESSDDLSLIGGISKLEEQLHS